MTAKEILPDTTISGRLILSPFRDNEYTIDRPVIGPTAGNNVECEDTLHERFRNCLVSASSDAYCALSRSHIPQRHNHANAQVRCRVDGP